MSVCRGRNFGADVKFAFEIWVALIIRVLFKILNRRVLFPPFSFFFLFFSFTLFFVLVKKVQRKRGERPRMQQPLLQCMGAKPQNYRCVHLEALSTFCWTETVHSCATSVAGSGREPRLWN